MDLLTTNYPEETQSAFKTKIADLSNFQCNIDINASVYELTETFKRISNLPGAVVKHGDKCVGMISRERCFETLGRPFGIELFLKRPVSDFLKKNGDNVLILPETTSIKDAVNFALMRPENELYDPVVVFFHEENEYRLLDMRTLLKAQSDLLSGLVVEVEKLSIIDPLTGLLNRRGFFSMAKNQVDLARQTDSDIAVMMVDIDLFKSVNDIYGHQVGDRVIREVAHEMKRSMRETDLVGRFGGEEFISLLTNIEENESWVVAERLRERIESLVIQTEFYNINVTISIGVSQINAGSTGMESLFSRADKALYEAKSSGRNRVVTWKNSSIFLPYNPRPVIRDEHLANKNGSKEEILHLYDETIEGWARALEMRDKETEGHAQRVTTLAVRMAQEIGFHKDDCENIRRGALLHDIGKIAIPDSVLLKEGKLDPWEWDIMKRHPIYAFDFLSPIKFFRNLIDIPYCHHEQWNGCGYPRGLKGEEIPLSARIFTLVDVFDALMTDRCYRPAWTRAATIEYIHAQTGLMFDPNLVPIFLDLISQKDPIEPLFNSKLLQIE